jgi:hypothetical protein
MADQNGYNPRQMMEGVNQEELQRLAETYKQRIARGEIQPEEAARQLQEYATGSSQPMTDLEGIHQQQMMKQSQMPSGPTVSANQGIMSGPTQPTPGQPPLGANPQVSIAMEKQYKPINPGSTPMQQNILNPTEQRQEQQYQQNLAPNMLTELQMRGANRQQAQQPGLLQQAGAGLKSMGKGMGGYMKNLFDDPNRMAMLQGGLSMMDPNTYYGKDGFGSVFTGLRRGVNAAVAGKQGVHDRRKSIAERKLTEAKTAAETNPTGTWKATALGDSSLLYNNAAIQRKTTQLMRGNPGMTIEQAEEKAIETTGVKVDKGLNPQQQRKLKAKSSSMKNMIKLADKIEKYAGKHPILSSPLTGTGADIINYPFKLFGNEGVWPSRTEFNTDLALIKPMITPAAMEKEDRITNLDKDLMLALVGADGYTKTGLDIKAAAGALARYMRISAADQGIDLGGAGREDQDAFAKDFIDNIGKAD